MRLDLFLAAARLVRRRSAAQALIEEGGVRIGGQAAKAGRRLREGDEFRLLAGGREIHVRVLALPGKRVSKASARELYEVLEERFLDEEPLEEAHRAEAREAGAPDGEAPEGGALDEVARAEGAEGQRAAPIDFLRGR